MNYIDFSTAPTDPIQRLAWMGGLNQALRTEVEAEFQRTYFEARIQGTLGPAIDLKLHSKKRVVAMTRHENEARGRAVSNWGDQF
jgi:hypothetical protein